MSALRLGLIGNPLGHSWSQRWFEEMFRREGIEDATYDLYPLPSLDGLREWVLQEGLAGFNVTIPYKESVIPYLDGLSEEARAIGAVNCVCVRDGRLTGHNTDAPAFRETLLPRLKPWHTRALVLGTGGASKAVSHVLRGLGVEPTLVSRGRTRGYAPTKRLSRVVSYAEAADLVKSHLLVVNATPVGMYPATEATPWPYADLRTVRHLAYDLVYNPAPTLFLKQASEGGAATLGGLPMLHRQAELSWDLWQ
ncbi:MAG: shikimate dehydrogenase [Bacteroidales bacterium]|nr:shikimate dehydrogenase [Bacteroidales bacterium]